MIFVSEMMRLQIANIITGIRILGSILLLFFPIFSLEFYVILSAVLVI